MVLRKLLAANTTALLAEKLLRLAAGVLVILMLARYLGANALGTYAIIMACYGFLLPLTSLGLQNIVVRELSQQPNPQALGLLYAAIGLRLVAALAFAAFILPLFFYLYPVPDDAVLPFAIALLLVLQSLQALQLLEFYLNYLGQFKRLAYSKAALLLLTLLLKAWALHYGYGLATLLMLTAAELVFTALLQLWLYQRQQGAAALSVWAACRLSQRAWVQLCALLKKSSWLWLSGMVAVVYLKIDVLMLGALAGAEQAGIYSAATKITELWYVVPATLALRFYPILLKRFNSAPASYYRLLRRYSALFLVLALVIATVMSVAAPWLVSALFGAEFMAAVPVLRIHIWACCFVFLRYLVSQHLLITQQEPLSLLSHGIAAILNVLLNFWLIPLYGMAGAAWATLIAYAYSACFFLVLTAKTRQQLWCLFRAK